MKMKKVFGILLTLVMAIGLLPGMCLTGYADTSVTYLDANGKQKSCTSYTVVESDTSFNNAWYVANHDVTISSQPEKQELKLSDAYDGEGDIEVRVTMLNINYGKNQQLMDACEPLKEYAWLVDAVRTRQKEKMDLDAAVDAAISDMPEAYVIKPFLIANRSEVKSMFLTEYDAEKEMEKARREAIREGHAVGRAEGRAEGEKRLGSLMARLISMNRFDDAKRCAEDEAYREKLYKEFQLA